jgi:hypothetical protein
MRDVGFLRIRGSFDDFATLFQNLAESQTFNWVLTLGGIFARLISGAKVVRREHRENNPNVDKRGLYLIV